MGLITSRVKLLWEWASTATSFSSQVSITIGTNIILASIGFITGPISARLLQPEGRGELAAIQMWPSFFVLFALFGLPEAVVYFSAKKPQESGQYMTTALIMSLIFSIPVFIVGYLLMPTLLAAQSPEIILSAQWYLLYILLYIVIITPLSLMRGIGEILLWNICRSFFTIMWVIALCIIIFSRNLSAQLLATVYLFLIGLSIFPIFFIIKKLKPSQFWPLIPGGWKPMINYGYPLVLAGVPSRLNFSLDQMIMAGLFSAKDLGLYVVALSWSWVSSPVIDGIGKVLFPGTAAQVNKSLKLDYLTRATRLASSLSFGLMVPLLFLTPIAIRLLFGMDFTEVIPTAMILVVASAFFNIKVVLQEGARGLGNPRDVLWSECVGLITTGVMLLLLLNPLGLIGAAIASLISYMVNVAFLTWRIKESVNCTISMVLIPQHSDVDIIKDKLIRILARKR